MATTKIDRTGAHTEVTTTEARQARQVGLIWVLSISMALAVIAGVVLGFGWITLPWGA
jgi:cytochrome b subunit of formate dehydrogenase